MKHNSASSMNEFHIEVDSHEKLNILDVNKEMLCRTLKDRVLSSSQAENIMFTLSSYGFYQIIHCCFHFCFKARIEK